LRAIIRQVALGIDEFINFRNLLHSQ